MPRPPLPEPYRIKRVESMTLPPRKRRLVHGPKLLRFFQARFDAAQTAVPTGR